MLSFASAQANDFNVIGSRTRTMTTSGSTYVLVQKDISDSLRVYATIVGSSHFSVSPSSAFFNASDTAKSFIVSFSTTTNDTSNAILLLSGNNSTDTVRLTGYDTSYTHRVPTRDFDEIVVVRSLTIWPSHDSTLGYFIIRRAADTTVVVTATIQGAGWSLGDSSIQTLTRTLTSASNYSIPIVYWSSHHQRDTAMLVLSANNPLVQRDTFYIYGSDSNYSHSALHLSFAAADFDTTVFYDTTCKTIYLTNPNASAITLTSLLASTSNGGSSWISSAPSLPISIAAGDSVAFTLCFTPYWPGAASSTITAQFSDSQSKYGTDSRTYGFVGENCFTANTDSILVDDVYLGGYSDVSVTFHFNKAYSNVTWTGDSTGLVTLIGSNPFSVVKGETKTLTFRVHPSAIGPYNRYSYLSAGNCSSLLEMFGRALPNSADTLNLFSPSSDLLKMQTASDTVTRTFTFRNNSGSTMRVTNVSLAQGSHFAITGIHPHATPDTLANLGLLGVDLLFQGDTNGTYDDSLTIVTDGMLQAVTFHLQAIKNALSVTQIEPNPIMLQITPNPAQGPVTIDVTGVRSADLEVFDLLGHRIAESNTGGSWRWSTSDVAAGTYIVRATGELNGTTFTKSQRIVVTR
jgi:hypothetical protein